MAISRSTIDPLTQADERLVQQLSSRKFLGYVGASSALLVTVGSACKKNDVEIQV